MNHARFDLVQDDMTVVSTEGPREQAWASMLHYAMVYGQDGPVEVYEVRKGKRMRVPSPAAEDIRSTQP